jgi:hypothetical protein
LASAVLLRNAPDMAREFSVLCTAADRAAALRFCLKVAFRLSVADRFEFTAALRLAARLPCTANER